MNTKTRQNNRPRHQRSGPAGAEAEYDNGPEITHVFFYAQGESQPLQFVTKRFLDSLDLGAENQSGATTCDSIGMGANAVGMPAVIVNMEGGEQRIFAGIPHQLRQRQLSELYTPTKSPGIV